MRIQQAIRVLKSTDDRWKTRQGIINKTGFHPRGTTASALRDGRGKLSHVSRLIPHPPASFALASQGGRRPRRRLPGAREFGEGTQRQGR